MALKDRNSSSSSSIFVSYGDVFEDDENSVQKRDTRDKLHRCLNRVWVHTAIVVIVLVQLLIITFLLLIHFEVIQDPPTSSKNEDKTSRSNLTGSDETETGMKESPVEETEDVFNAINIVIFSAFVIEILLRVVAKGSSIIQDKLQVFDGVVVLFVCVIYIALLAADTDRNVVYGFAYLIVLRLWRMGRIYHDITEGERRKAERVINAHRKAAKDAEQYARSMIAKVEQQQHEITTLREHNKVLKQNDTNSSPAMRSVSQHTYTPDDPGTSEDEFEHYHYEKNTKKVLEMVKVELSNGHTRTPNGSLPSGTPNGSVPNMTPTSSCSYLTGDANDADKVSNKFPDLVEQAQGLEVKEAVEGQCQTHELQTKSNIDNTVAKKGSCENNNAVTHTTSPNLSSTQASDNGSNTKRQESMSHTDNGNYAYSNAGFELDSESHGQNPTESQAETQPCSSKSDLANVKASTKSKYDDFGSTTYLNQDGIPMTDL